MKKKNRFRNGKKTSGTAPRDLGVVGSALAKAYGTVPRTIADDVLLMASGENAVDRPDDCIAATKKFVILIEGTTTRARNRSE